MLRLAASSKPALHFYEMPTTGPLEGKLMFECADHDVVKDYVSLRDPRVEVFE
jgi:hypothetical protein